MRPASPSSRSPSRSPAAPPEIRRRRPRRPANLTIIGSPDLPDEPDAVHVIDGIVWVAQTKGPELVRVGGTPDAPAVERRIPLGTAAALADRANVDFAAVGGELWVTAPQSDVVHIGPRQ